MSQEKSNTMPMQIFFFGGGGWGGRWGGGKRCTMGFVEVVNTVCSHDVTAAMLEE